MTDTPPRDDPQCDHELPPDADVAPNFLACVKCGHFETLVPPVRYGQPRKVGGWHVIPFERPVPFEAGDTVPAMTPEQVVAILAPERPGTLPWTGTWRTEPDGSRVCDFRLTDLHWGEGVSTDANRTDREVGIPVCDDDGREIGEMRMGYANGRALLVMLADAVLGGPLHTIPVERLPLDQMNDDLLDHLYDQLNTAAHVINAYMIRSNPETWQRQADQLARQSVRLGECEATLARVAELARRWEHIPAKHAAAEQLLVALGMRKERE